MEKTRILRNKRKTFGRTPTFLFQLAGTEITIPLIFGQNLLSSCAITGTPSEFFSLPMTLQGWNSKRCSSPRWGKKCFQLTKESFQSFQRNYSVAKLESAWGPCGGIYQLRDPGNEFGREKTEASKLVNSSLQSKRLEEA